MIFKTISITENFSRVAISKRAENINPFTADPVKALHFAILVKPTIFNFWHSGALALSPERQSARMSKIKNGGLDQYAAGPFEQEQFGTAGIQGLTIDATGSKRKSSCRICGVFSTG